MKHLDGCDSKRACVSLYNTNHVISFCAVRIKSGSGDGQASGLGTSQSTNTVVVRVIFVNYAIAYEKLHSHKSDGNDDITLLTFNPTGGATEE